MERFGNAQPDKMHPKYPIYCLRIGSSRLARPIPQEKIESPRREQMSVESKMGILKALVYKEGGNMVENWTCSTCASLNPPRRDRCWNCGTHRIGVQSATAMGASTRKPAARARAASQRARLGIGVVASAVVMVIGYVALQYLLDRHNYNQGHAAYRQTDCSVAIGHYDKVLDGWRLTNIGGFTEFAQNERAECILFQAAVDRHEAKDLSGALAVYSDFVNGVSESVLTRAARQRTQRLFDQFPPSELAGQDLCERIDALLTNNLLPERDRYLPGFYLACGQVYGTLGQHGRALAIHKRLLIEYAEHALSGEAEAAIRVNPIVCQEIDALQEEEVIASRADFLPSIYSNCGQAYDTEQAYLDSFAMYKALLINYPDHPLASSAETAFLYNLSTCERYQALEKTNIAERADFFPRLFYACGKAYTASQDYRQAIGMFEQFQSAYPGHSLASEVEAALAQAIVAEAKTSNVAEIPEPERTGFTSAGNTVVIIQNDSPEQLRIAFSGPESRIEELDACDSCKNYSIVGPVFCPEEGPIGRYALAPGEYDVVVEAIGDRGVTPFKGEWALGSGDEYFSCFFIVTTFWP
jgi:tetratricopeptide (TPR) repeat protein